MAFFSISGIDITDIAIAVPENSVNNSDLDILDYEDRESFSQKIGIYSRRVAPAGLCASDLCVAATERLIALKGYARNAFGAVVFVTQTPDYLLPGNSMLAQCRLGLPPTMLMLDLNQGCAGYVYGLATLTSVMQSMGIERGLLLVGDTITRLLSPSDASTIPIFSDAGSATVLEKSKTGGTMHFNLGGDGSGAGIIRVAAGGARHPFRPGQEGIGDAPYLSMKGIDVLNYSLRYIAPNIQQLLDLSGQTMEGIDHFIFHQANKILNNSLLRKLGIPEDKAPSTLGQFGNTSCATIPLTIHQQISNQLASRKQRLLLSGFGVGFSWGSALVDLGPVRFADLIEIPSPNG